MTAAQPTPINMAEAIVDPFWDPELSELPAWRIRPGAAHGLRVNQAWCWVTFEWARKPARGAALAMERTRRIPCGDYDRLILSIMPPHAARVTIRLLTDRGPVEKRHVQADARKAEIAVPLRGAREIRKITVLIEAGADGIGTGWINWIGLQHARRLRFAEAEWNRFDSAWDKRLRPDGYTPAWSGGRLLADPPLWKKLVARHAAHVRRQGSSPFLEAAKPFLARDPEGLIGDYINFWNDTRYCRNREFGRQLLHPGPSGALPVAAFLSRDPALLRRAARHALAIGLCGHWDDGMICRFPGGTFEHRSFVQSLCAHEVALALDLCGEWMTAQARAFLMRRLAEEGLASITFNTWAHPYIHDCNQLAWFSPGRMAAYAALAPHWPRTAEYMDIAYRELVDSLEKTVLPDGGYGEGPTYFRCVGRDGGQALYYYSRAKGIDFKRLLPDAFRRAASLGALVESTVPGQDVIPICDAGAVAESDLLGVMAYASPRSRWHAMFRKKLARSEGMPDSILPLIIQETLSGEPDPQPALVRMPVMGPVASFRMHRGEPVKLLIMGGQKGAGHTHEDKGSFVLEYAGDTYAMDPGTCDYSHPLALQLKFAQRHNMLAPEDVRGRAAPRCPLPADVKPAARGDRTRFWCRIDCTPGWEGLFTKWIRTWESPDPGRLVVSDVYVLAAGMMAAFYWSTRLPVKLGNGLAVITGRRSRLELVIPPGCDASLDELPLLDGTVQRRLVFRKKGQTGRLRVEARLVPG
jgi:hypothetical protein